MKGGGDQVMNTDTKGLEGKKAGEDTEGWVARATSLWHHLAKTKLTEVHEAFNGVSDQQKNNLG